MRKNYNKIHHENCKYEDKMKYFLQFSNELSIDIESASAKGKSYKEQLEYLSKILAQKDKQIFE